MSGMASFMSCLRLRKMVGFAALNPPYNAARDANTSYRTNGPPNVRGVLQVRQLRDVRRDAPRLIAR